MSFKNLLIKTDTVKLSPDVTVTLRGLNTTDVMLLLNEYEDIAEMIFDGVDFEKDEDGSAQSLLTRAPALAYLAVAMAADEPDAATTIARLPIPMQLDLISRVYRLTFPNPKQDIKKLKSALSLLLKK